MSTPGERIKQIAKSVFGSVGNMAVALKMTQASLSQYITARRDVGPALILNLERIGIGSDYILSGNGSVYADNDAGRKLREQHNAALRFASKNVSAVQELESTVDTEVGEDEEDENLVQFLHKRYELLRTWLTESGTITEWYLKCKEAAPSMTLTDVLALEGFAEGGSKRPPKDFFAFVHKSGVDVSWLEGFIDGDPFREGAEGDALKERLIKRFLSESSDESLARLRDSVRQLSHQGALQDYEPQ